MSHTSEFELIGRISAAAAVPDGITGIGDDCAIIPQQEGLDTLVTTDLLIEGRHFLLKDVSPYELGWKSAAVNISDIAAMGGRPVGAFLSIALPPSLASVPDEPEADATAKPHPADAANPGNAGVTEPGADASDASRPDTPWIDRFISGFLDACGRFGVALLGGDTSASDGKLFINVTLTGECTHSRALTRSGARTGDIIYVTGPLGDSGAGLKLVLERAAGRLSDLIPDEQMLVRRHYMPLPRVEEGLKLSQAQGVHSMMDISDGIASDLRHIL